MAKLFVEIDDTLLSRVLIDSQEQGINLNTFITDALNTALASPNLILPRKTVNVDDVIKRAINIARSKDVGSEFMLRELCTDDDWEALSGGEHKSLGKLFRKAVEGITPPIAAYAYRTSSNKAVYKRI